MHGARAVYLKRLQAAQAIKQERAQQGQGATLQTLATRGCVGLKAAYKKVGFRSPEVVA